MARLTDRQTGHAWDGAPTRYHALALVRPALWGAVNDVMAALHCDVEFARNQALFATRMESDEPDCAIIDSDATASTEALLRFTRSLWPQVILIALVARWCNDEARLKPLCSAVLHVPPRAAEWEPQVDRLLRERADSRAG